MTHKQPRTSAFNDIFLRPLQRDLYEAAKAHGVGTPEYLQAVSDARIRHGLRLDGEILRRLELEKIA